MPAMSEQEARDGLVRLASEAGPWRDLREAAAKLMGVFHPEMDIGAALGVCRSQLARIDEEARPLHAAIRRAEAEQDPRPPACEHQAGAVGCRHQASELGVCSPGLCPLVGEITEAGLAMLAEARELAA